MADHFRRKARRFDSVYGRGGSVVARALRPVIFERAEAAARLVEAHDTPPRVLEVGCGSGRVAEVLLTAGGVGAYVGIDVSEPMIALASERLRPWRDRVELVSSDFLTAPLEGSFDVVVALGLFEYLERPEAFTRRIRAHCDGALIATFPRWTWTKGPLRKLKYEVLNDCPIYDYTAREIELLLRASGFGEVMIEPRRHGFIVRATSSAG